jgi:replication factor C subunit 2/4
VRDKIKKYSQKLVSKIADRNAPNFQIVILDEADSMTNDAQSALRRVIEDYTKNTRFCFICNYVSKIIDPIASRCAKYRFSPLTRDTQLARLKFIGEKEKLTVDEGVMNFLIDISEGDLRRSINLLQSISQLGSDLMTPQVINDICGIIPVEDVEALFNSARTMNTDNVIKTADEFFYSGYDLRQLLVQLNELVVNRRDLTEEEKIKICEIIQDSEINLLEGASPNLKLYSLLAEIKKVANKN